MHEYKTARSIFGFIEFCAWSVVVIGVVATLAGMAGGNLIGSSGGVWGAIPGLAVVFIGLASVMMVQIGRATIDTAQMTGKLLQNSNEELRLLKALPGDGNLQAGYATRDPAVSILESQSNSTPAASEPSQELEESNLQSERNILKKRVEISGSCTHNGYEITVAGEGFQISGTWFETVDQAIDYIENNEPKLISAR